jgi:Coenzyme PQQ synthesis protein D (PqqD)
MKLSKYVKFREEKFGGVLFETQSEKVFTLNPTAAAVVREIAAGTDENAIAKRITEHFNGDAGTIQNEVQQFLTDLRSKGLAED